MEILATTQSHARDRPASITVPVTTCSCHLPGLETCWSAERPVRVQKVMAVQPSRWKNSRIGPYQSLFSEHSKKISVCRIQVMTALWLHLLGHRSSSITGNNLSNSGFALIQKCEKQTESVISISEGRNSKFYTVGLIFLFAKVCCFKAKGYV